MSRIAILDYGAGNLGSVRRAVHALGVEHEVVRTPDALAGVDKLIFPGVGAAGQAMAALRALGLIDALLAHARSGKPLLGICVGMQVLGTRSEEDGAEGLGLLPYEMARFRVDEPVPHMGWNSLSWNSLNPSSAAFARGLGADANVYYVHSYCAPVGVRGNPGAQGGESCVAATSIYAGITFIGAVARGNIWGTQFHAEKSGPTGLRILKNFLEL